MSGTSPGFDPAIALQARSPVAPNPLQQIGEYANAANSINRLKMFPGELALQGQQVQGGQLSLTQHINQAAAGALAHMMAEPVGSITHEKATNGIAIGEAQHIPMGNVVGAMAQFPQGDGPDFDAAFRRWVLANGQAPANAAGVVLPGQTTVDQGLGVQPMNVGPRGLPGQGVMTPAGSQIPVYPSRAASAARVQVGVDASGAPVYGPAANVTPPALSGLPGPFGTGRPVPPALLNPNAPRAAAPIGNTETGNVVTGIGPTAHAAAAKTGADAAAGFSNIADQGNRAVQQNAILSNMQSDLAQFSSGTGANKTLDFKRALVSWAPSVAAAVGVDPKAVAANESFDKLAAQIADAQGAGSDHRLEVTQAANPHAGLSPGGADLIIRQLQGNADYMRMMQQQAAAHPDQTDYRGFSAKMATALDPRFFQLNRMTSEQGKDYLSAMKEPQKTEFKKAYISARNNGLLGNANGGQ